LTISKEKVIVLTSYERRSLFRFLALYLGSVFVLLVIIGYLFFENNRVAMKSAMKFEMMYQARMLLSKVIMKAMDENMLSDERFDLHNFLKTLKHCRFQVGYYDKNKQSIYSEIEHVKRFDTDFFVEDKKCYTVTEDKNDHLGVHYTVLRENELAKKLQALRLKIIGYLILSFILMAVVGYFLGRLFLKPVREQIESLDKFISDTTHELNTPISAILMTIQSLKDVEPKKMKRLAASAKRLSTMYGSLTYRLEGKVESSGELCLAEVVRERAEFAQELIDSKRLEIVLDLESTPVMISKRSLHRLIDNLISNAIKYSDPGGKITISIKDHILRISDTGIGIDEKLQRDIFRRYYRANDKQGGFGIGLDIVLDLYSKKGEGATFILTFPKVRTKQ